MRWFDADAGGIESNTVLIGRVFWRTRTRLGTIWPAILIDGTTKLYPMSDTNTELKTWMCLICGWIYDEEQGSPDDGIAPGTKWEDVPINWTCPECGARKEDFEIVQI